MILVGNQRGGAKDLADHLLKQENEHVEVHELRGFVADDLHGAFTETYAISRGTKCKQFLFSLSLNPPAGENVPTAEFEAAIEQAEAKLGLGGQPRAVVFHEKEGRRHAHCVWSRIRVDEMKAVRMSHSHQKLMDVSRDLYREHGWKMPEGMADRAKRNPLNFTLEEWQQAKRVERDPKEIKTAMQDAWAISDSKAAFEHALKERGFWLARGDRRGFVALDHKGEAYSLSRWVGVKPGQLRERLGDEKELRGVEDTNALIAAEMAPKMRDFEAEAARERQQRKQAFETKRQNLVTHQRGEREALATAQAQRQVKEAQLRQERFRSGLKGLWDRMRGEHRRIRELNLRDYEQAQRRDRDEKDRLVFRHLDQRRALVEERIAERKQGLELKSEIIADRARFEAGQLAPEREPRKPDRTRAGRRVDKAPQRPAKETSVNATFKAGASDEKADLSPAASSREELSREERREAFKAKRREQQPEHSRAPKLER